VDKIKAQQDDAVEGTWLNRREDAERSKEGSEIRANGSTEKPVLEEVSTESGTNGGYRSQAQLEAELTDLSAELVKFKEDNQELAELSGRRDRELQEAQQNIAMLAERVRQAEKWELAYRRRADELQAEIAIYKQQVG